MTCGEPESGEINPQVPGFAEGVVKAARQHLHLRSVSLRSSGHHRLINSTPQQLRNWRKSAAAMSLFVLAFQ